MFGMQLRSVGESQANNCYKLLASFPNTGHNTTVTFDCGYGKFDFVYQMISRGFKVSTYAATLGLRHPFIPLKEKRHMKLHYNQKVQ